MKIETIVCPKCLKSDMSLQKESDYFYCFYCEHDENDKSKLISIITEVEIPKPQIPKPHIEKGTLIRVWSDENEIKYFAHFVGWSGEKIKASGWEDELIMVWENYELISNDEINPKKEKL